MRDVAVGEVLIRFVVDVEDTALTAQLVDEGVAHRLALPMQAVERRGDAAAARQVDGQPQDLPPHPIWFASRMGGLAFGRTAAGSHVRLDGKSMPIAGDGRFLLGFGRDQAPHATLAIAHPDGKTETQELAITQRKFDDAYSVDVEVKDEMGNVGSTSNQLITGRPDPTLKTAGSQQIQGALALE